MKDEKANAVLSLRYKKQLPVQWQRENEAMATLKHQLGVYQHFVPVYIPWINDSIKCLNNYILLVVHKHHSLSMCKPFISGRSQLESFLSKFIEPS